MTDALRALSPFFATPLPSNGTVHEVMTRLSEHPVWNISRQDCLCRGVPGRERYRVFQENQANWDVFTMDPDAPDPTLFLAAPEVDLLDRGFQRSELVHGTVPLGGFQRFLWHMIGHVLVLRCEDEVGDPAIAPEVVFAHHADAATEELWCASETRFWGPHSVWIGPGRVVIPGWGSARLRGAPPA